MAVNVIVYQYDFIVKTEIIITIEIFTYYYKYAFKLCFQYENDK